MGAGFMRGSKAWLIRGGGGFVNMSTGSMWGFRARLITLACIELSQEDQHASFQHAEART